MPSLQSENDAFHFHPPSPTANHPSYLLNCTSASDCSTICTAQIDSIIQACMMRFPSCVCVFFFCFCFSYIPCGTAQSATALPKRTKARAQSQSVPQEGSNVLVYTILQTHVLVCTGRWQQQFDYPEPRPGRMDGWHTVWNVPCGKKGMLRGSWRCEAMKIMMMCMHSRCTSSRLECSGRCIGRARGVRLLVVWISISHRSVVV